MHPPEADCFLQKTNLFYFFRSFFSDSESPGLTDPTRGSNPKESYLPIMRTGSVLGGVTLAEVIYLPCVPPDTVHSR
jgi:hypothetical protein